MPSENSRRFAGNEVRRDAAMTLAEQIERRGNRGAPAYRKMTCSVRDDGSHHIIFVDQRDDAKVTTLATVDVYAPGKAKARGRYSDNSAIVDAIAWFKQNVT